MCNKNVHVKGIEPWRNDMVIDFVKQYPLLAAWLSSQNVCTWLCFNYTGRVSRDMYFHYHIRKKML